MGWRFIFVTRRVGILAFGAWEPSCGQPMEQPPTRDQGMPAGSVFTCDNRGKFASILVFWEGERCRAVGRRSRVKG